MTAEMLQRFFEIVQRCDGTEAMMLASAALELSNKSDRGAGRCSSGEEFVLWFQETAGTFGTRAAVEGKPESQAAYYQNEWMGMSAG